MTFAQRLDESFKVRDRKAITNGTSIRTAKSSSNSCPIFKPPISPVFRNWFKTPGSMVPNIITAKKAAV
jgi:hypothetical protein